MTAHSVRPRRRLRSATVNLGAVAVLALSLTACDVVSDDDDDDDDCALGTGDRAVAVAPLHVAAVSGRVAAPAGPEAEALPARGGFGTHLAYGCGG